MICVFHPDISVLLPVVTTGVPFLSRKTSIAVISITAQAMPSWLENGISFAFAFQLFMYRNAHRGPILHL